MLKKSRCKLVLLVSFLGLFAAADSLAGKGSSQWVVWPELLEAAKLEVVWENQLPIRKKEAVESLIVVGNHLYVLSDKNYLVSLNKERGNVIFSRPIAGVGLPIVGMGHFEGQVFSIIGNRLVEINPEFGTEIGSTRLEFNATCPAARNSSYFYIAGTDKRVRALLSDEKVKIFEVAAENDSAITSVIADDNVFVFSTEGGNVIRVTPDGPRRQWQFDASGGVVGPVVRNGSNLFFASKDTNVYNISVRTGALVWKYQTAAMLDAPPRVTKEVVYQYVRNKGLTAVDKESGKLLWDLDGGADLLAEAGGKAYVITETGMLVVMDNKKAERLYSVNFSGVSKYLSNVTDTKIYVADDSGRIACLKPVE